PDLFIIAIRGADRNCFEARKDIQLGERNAGDPVDSDCVTHAHGIKPTAAARSPRGCPKLRAFTLERLTLRTEKLGGKGSASHSGCIGFRDADHLMDMLRTDARATQRSSGT